MSTRKKAWRNVMVAAINAGLDQKVFDLDAGPEGVVQFRFEIEGVPAVAHVSNAGWDELSISVALWPTAEGERWVSCSNAGFLAGDCFAHGWLERRKGQWLQTPGRPEFQCRDARKATVEALAVKPNGYADHGRFMM